MIVLFDYLSMTFSGYSVYDVKLALGLLDASWIPGSPARGYSCCEFFSSIKIFSSPPSNNRFNVWLEMSGQGCRSFESFGSGHWDSLFDFYRLDPDNVHITRLDLAFDDAPIDPLLNIDESSSDGLLDLDLIKSQVLDYNRNPSDPNYKCNSNFVSKFQFWNVEESTHGLTIYFGSPQSSLRFRIYDKAQERGFVYLHWVRFEIQLRDDRAQAFITALSHNDLGQYFKMLINNYLRFIVPDDINKSRCSTAEWWLRFIDEVGKLRLVTPCGLDYNLPKLYHYYTESHANGLYTLVELVGADEFLSAIKTNRSPELPLKYQVLFAENEKK